MRFISRKSCLISCGVGFFSVILLLLATLIYAKKRPSGKYQSVQPVRTPFSVQTELTLEKQVEPHTCGLHSISAIYKYYGLDPDSLRLRFRLGVDRRANPFDPETLGVIQPDILRVVNQDGFAVDILDLEQQNVAQELRAHLEKDLFALTLIRRRENGNLHWVVLCGYEDGKLKVADSLRPVKYWEPLPDFMADHILSVMMLKPSTSMEETRISLQHKRGVKEMKKTGARMQQ